MTEPQYQSYLKQKIKDLFPGCIVQKEDPEYLQGIPDLLILWKDHWATLECKRSEKASHRPNQEYYVNQMNEMSYSAFIFPENKERILDDMEQAFGA